MILNGFYKIFEEKNSMAGEASIPSKQSIEHARLLPPPAGTKSDFYINSRRLNSW